MSLSSLRRYAWNAALAALVVLAVAGCVPGDGTATEANPAGLLWGVWHGWIAPISLVLSLFDPKFTIYESANTGFWYDFGFYIAIISGFGGLSLLRRR